MPTHHGLDHDIERERVRHARTMLRDARKFSAAAPPPAAPPDPGQWVLLQGVALGLVLAAVSASAMWHVDLPSTLKVTVSLSAGASLAAGIVGASHMTALVATRHDRPSYAWLGVTGVLSLGSALSVHVGAADAARPWAGIAAGAVVAALSGAVTRALEHHHRARAFWRLDADAHDAASARVRAAERCLAEAEEDLSRSRDLWLSSGLRSSAGGDTVAPVPGENAPADDGVATK